MKTLNIIKKIAGSILLVVFFAFTITMTILLLNFNKYGVTQFDDTSILLIKKSFSSETYKKDSLVIVEKKNIKDYVPGDEVFVYHLDGHGGVNIELGVVGQVFPDPRDNAITFVNGGTYSNEYIIGTGEKVYANIGLLLSIVESKWGFLFIILVPNLFLFIYQLYNLVVEIRYGKDE